MHINEEVFNDPITSFSPWNDKLVEHPTEGVAIKVVLLFLEVHSWRYIHLEHSTIALVSLFDASHLTTDMPFGSA